MKKSKDGETVLTKNNRGKKVKSLDYWKKQLLGALSGNLEKSLGDILYNGDVPQEAEILLIKAKGYPVGTIREWRGKKFKKLSSGKWVRSYEGKGDRGEKQAIRNVRNKIENASSISELATIVSENMQRFKDSSGRTLPVVKEFIDFARSTDAGKKKSPVYEEKVNKIAEISGVDEDKVNEAIEKVKSDNPDGKIDSLSVVAELNKEKQINPIKEKYQSGKSIEGDQDDIYVGDNEVSGTWKLVEADSPSASHDESTFGKTEGFPTREDGSTINDRDYENDKDAQLSVVNMAGNFDGRALHFDSPVVVSPDGIVISGNNRTMSSKLAAKKGTDKKYIEALNKRARKFGFSKDDVSKFKNPRVVFEVDSKDYSTKNFAKFNEVSQKQMNPVEAAVKMSKTVNEEVIKNIASQIDEFDTIGELYNNKKAVKDVFNTLELGGVINSFTRPQYITDSGITGAGKEFLETVLIGSAIHEKNIRRLNDNKQLRRKLVRGILPLIENKSMGGYSITNEINDAIDILSQVKSAKGIETIDDFEKQSNMFEDVDPVAMRLARKMEMKEKDFAEFLKKMNGSLKVGASGQADIFLGEAESKDSILDRMLKSKNDLNYWKKKLLESLSGNLEKSLNDILYPDGVPAGLDGLLLKARGYAVGTIRKWSGKEYKKISPSRWVRTYSETESRGAKQAIRNVRNKIENAETMEELVKIISENQKRFQGKDGKMLPIVKQFMLAARETKPGAKKKGRYIEPSRMYADGTFQIDEDKAESLIDMLKGKGDYFFQTEDNEYYSFYKSVDQGGSIEAVSINPYDEINQPIKEDNMQEQITKSIDTDDFRSYGAWNPKGKGLSAKQREELNQEIAEILKKDFYTEEEKEKIRAYSGFGGTKVSDERGLLYDYYTSPVVAKMVLQTINKIKEVKRGDSILEPSCGTGVFFDVMPEGLEKTGVEYDSRTAKACDVLQDDVQVNTGSFEEFNLHNDKKFDFVIGNCPFGKRSVETSFMDQDLNALGKPIAGEDTLDRYFISKSLDNLKSEGVMGMIAYSGIMSNKTNRDWRVEMLRKGQFIGAQQLPNESFKHSHTSVSPDVYYFKKHPDHILERLKTASEAELKKSGAWNADWVEGSYYENNPQNRLGEKAQGNFGSIITKGKVTDEILNNAVSDFSANKTNIDVSEVKKVNIKDQKVSSKPTKDEASAIVAKTLLVGMTKVINGKVYMLNANHRWELVDVIEDDAERVKDANSISAKIKEIRKAMQNDENPSNIQNEARKLIDEYEEKHGSSPSQDVSLKRIISKNPNMKNIHEAFNVTRDSGILNNKNIFDSEVDIKDGHQPDIVALKEIQKLNSKANIQTLKRLYPNDYKKLTDLMMKNKDIFLTNDNIFQLREDFIAGDAWEKIDNLTSTIEEGIDTKESIEKMKYGISELEKAIGWVSLEDSDISPMSSWIPLDIVNKWAEEEYDTKVYKNSDGSWDGHGSWRSKELIYFLNNQKQRGGSKEENEIKTVEYNQTARDSFSNFISTNEDIRKILEPMYNRKFNTELGVPNKTYSIDIDGWSDSITLQPWQWQSIHHLYEKGKGLSAMGTGFGKTYAAIGLMGVLRQEGKIKRPMFQVPNNKVSDWVKYISKAMPELKIGFVDPEESDSNTRAKRNQKYQEIANSDLDVVIMAESCGSEIQLNEENDKQIMDDIISSQIVDAKTDKQREKAKQSAEAKYQAGRKNTTITFEELGIDSIFVDEAHNYKNLFSSSLSRETGLNDGKRSERALSLYKKNEYIRQSHDGKNVFLLTATPLTNSPLEYYNMISHVAPEELQRLNINNINDFIENFADIQMSDDYDWSTGQLAQKKKLLGFKELRSLQNMFFKYTDYQNDPTKIGIEKPKPTNIANTLPKDDKQANVMEMLSDQYKDYKKDKEKYPDQNTLTFYAKMRTASLDLELYNPTRFKDWKNPKLEKMVENAKDSYDKTKGGQVIFCDRVVSSDKTFNMHEKIKARLIKQGFKPEEIVIVNGITKSGGKQSESALQSRVKDVIDGYNTGKYKVVIGTTGTIGEGVNLQHNSAALHHFDIPFRPSDFAQRNGRIDRQGNKQKNVELNTYSAQGTIDNYSIGKVAGKEDWINKLLNSKSSVFTNPDGEGVDFDELMISLEGEFGRDTTAMREELKKKKESKVKERNTAAMNNTMKKLSVIRGSIASFNGDKGSKLYQNMLNKESVYVSTLQKNPEFKNHDLVNGERTPFLYNSKSGNIIKIGDSYLFRDKIRSVESIDYKKGIAYFYNPEEADRIYSGDKQEWSIKSGWGWSGEGKYLDVKTPEELATAKKVIEGGFQTLSNDDKKKYYSLAVDSYNSYDNYNFVMNDGKVSASGDGVKLNPYIPEDRKKIENYINETQKMKQEDDQNDYTYSNNVYFINKALERSWIPEDMKSLKIDKE